MSTRRRADLPAGIAADLLVLATLAYAAYLEMRDPELYYLSVQEDEYLEWGTFWGFLLAAGIWVGSALRRHDTDFKRSWFLLGLGAFCFAVAMEEISWGQRLFGYRPPDYFLKHNFQQELNLHNVIGTSWRKLALKAVIAGYGVVLPLAALVPALRRLLERAAVLAPGVVMTPAFLATYVTYEQYPWEYSGEWVELMLAQCFLFFAIIRARDPRAVTPRLAVASVVVSWLLVAGLGAATAAVWRGQRAARPETVAAARTELEALRRDFLVGRLRTKCGLHKRLYTYVEEYGEEYLREGEFARLEAGGLPEARARFFLDPWNSPYWIYDLCGEDRSRRKVFIYSLGPNRRLDSPSWQMKGDDMIFVVRRR